MRWFPFLALVVLGCASAGSGGNNPDGNAGTDGSTTDGKTPDAAPMPDALQMSTLTQTADTTIATASSIACGANGATAENSWYRVFQLPMHGVTGPFAVTNVAFAVQESGGTQSVQVKLGTYGGAIGGNSLDTGLITPLNSATVTVPASASPQMLSTPITGTVPAGGKLVVEIFSPDHSGTTTHFYLGASAGTETAAAYLRAPDCMATQPVAVKQLNASTGSLIITVSGTH